MFFRVQTCIAVFLLLIGMSACKSGDQEKSVQSGQQQAVEQTQPSVAGQDQPAQEKEYGSGLDIKGKVMETMDVGGYTYLEVDDAKGPTWVAVPQQKIEKGQEVAITEGMEMRNFESKTLNRTFDKIYFSAALEGGAGQDNPPAEVSGAPATADASKAGSFEDALKSEGPSGGSATMNPADLTGGSQAAKVEAKDDIQVEKAAGDNAYTVGELFDKAKELDNQKVTVRGKIVKISTMIMGKNWLHIQDGTSGSAGNNDLVVTTMAEPEKDSVVVVEGTLHADKDFGAGYRYETIIEDAEVK